MIDQVAKIQKEINEMENEWRLNQETRILKFEKELNEKNKKLYELNIMEQDLKFKIRQEHAKIQQIQHILGMKETLGMKEKI